MVIIWNEKSEYSDISLLIRYIRIIHTCIHTFLERAASLSVWYKLKLHRYTTDVDRCWFYSFFYFNGEDKTEHLHEFYKGKIFAATEYTEGH